MNATANVLERDLPATVRWLVDGDRLTELAAQRGHDTDQKAADWLDIHRSMYSRIKNNKVRPNSHTMLTIADKFGVSVESIFRKVIIP